MATDMEAVIADIVTELAAMYLEGAPSEQLDTTAAILTVLQAAKAYVDAREAQPAWDADFALLDERYGALVRAMKGGTL